MQLTIVLHILKGIIMNAETVSAEIITLKISRKQFSSPEEITKIGQLNESIYMHLLENEKCKENLFAPIYSSEEEEIVLYWEGKDQNIFEGFGIYNYLYSEGYEVIDNPHLSILINAVAELSEAKLSELGIPEDVNIVLPVAGFSYLYDHKNRSCFLEIFRSGGHRRLDLIEFLSKEKWDYRFAFLLQRRKKS